jgi:hypothetical protein
MTTGRGPEPGFDFTVQTDGTLQFDPSLDPLVGGRGTKAMVLHGTRVDIDVSELSYRRLNLIAAGSLIEATGPVPFVLMPGGHGLTMTTGRDPEPEFNFTVQADGTLQFDPSLDPTVGGRGTTAVVLHGARINIDGRGLTASFAVDGLRSNPVEQILIATLMSGTHRFYSSEVDFVFAVTPDLTLDYDMALDGNVSGRGTITLVVSSRESLSDMVGAANTTAPLIESASFSVNVLWLPNPKMAAVTAYANALMPLTQLAPCCCATAAMPAARSQNRESSRAATRGRPFPHDGA